MKRLFTNILTLCFTAGALCITNPVHAEQISTLPGTSSMDVKGTYSGSVPSTVYSLDISWGNMEFTYETTGEKTWNPTQHTYTLTGEATWKSDGNTVSATNHSNADVNVAFSFAKDEDVVGNYEGNMSTASQKLLAGVENKPDEAAKVDSNLTITGTLGATNTTATKLGTVTVQVSTAS